jgi:hypothetical protein
MLASSLEVEGEAAVVEDCAPKVLTGEDKNTQGKTTRI